MIHQTKADCLYCGNEFSDKRSVIFSKDGSRKRKYCSVSCGAKAYGEKKGKTLINCLHCGKGFTEKNSVAFKKDGTRAKKYCSTSCASKNRHPQPYFACQKCGEETARSYSKNHKTYNYNQKYCSKECRVSAQSKGGSIHHSGYRVVRVDGKAVQEHRYIMEKIMGRPLKSDENVHHKNGQRAFNDPSNLEIWNTRQPKGQRVVDKIDFVIEMAKQYPEVLRARGFKFVALESQASTDLIGHSDNAYSISDALCGVMSFAA